MSPVQGFLSPEPRIRLLLGVRSRRARQKRAVEDQEHREHPEERVQEERAVAQEEPRGVRAEPPEAEEGPSALRRRPLLRGRQVLGDAVSGRRVARRSRARGF